MYNTVMIGIEGATCAHISINSQQFAPPLPGIQGHSQDSYKGVLIL